MEAAPQDKKQAGKHASGGVLTILGRQGCCRVVPGRRPDRRGNHYDLIDAYDWKNLFR